MKKKAIGEQADHQISLRLSGSDYPAPVKLAAKANKARHRLPVIQQPHLSIQEERFTPKEGVPRTRANCPTTRIDGLCDRVKCRQNLFLESAEHRAGRPGLASVPRDPFGRTERVKGQAGAERAGSTLRPDWLSERTCRGWLEIDAAGRVCAINVLGDAWGEGRTDGNADATWAAMRLHEGEALRVTSPDNGWATTATYRNGCIVLDREPFIGQVVAVWITRVRGVSSCALDEVQKHGAMTNTQIGDAIGRHRTLAARIVKNALGKAMTNAAEMGMSEADLLAGLRELGAG